MSSDSTMVDIYPREVQPGDYIEVAFYRDGEFRFELTKIIHVRVDAPSLRVALGFYPQGITMHPGAEPFWVTYDPREKVRRRITTPASKPYAPLDDRVEVTVRMSRGSVALLNAWAYSLRMDSATLIELAVMAGSRLMLGENLPRNYVNSAVSSGAGFESRASKEVRPQ